MNPFSRFASRGNIAYQVLWEDGQRVFCRGNDLGNDVSPLLAVLTANENPSPAALNRLAHEYELRDELDDAWAAKPLQLLREGGHTILMLKDPGGEPLDRHIGPPMEIGKFLRLAIAISIALARLHGRGLVHKDIKPTNLLVNDSADKVWLTGFGIASRRQSQSPAPPEFLEGTLAYMAPEQTGRMNRSIDSRSDLYALGIMFYQLLTGSLPFTAADPAEWAHCHIARTARPPSERSKNIPGPISEIVMKLLAKTAEERYQTAAGVESDLRHCLAEWERRGCIDQFVLGELDAPDRLLLSKKLYGREREIETMLASFDRVVSSGTVELLLVYGHSGIGKSSVVHEFHKVLVPPRGLFASGKFDQYKRDIPYSTLAQAFQSLIRSLLAKSDPELAGWREAFREALGPNGQLMIELVPELKLIVGDQPPIPELPPRDAQRRFQLVFRRFLAVFARPEHPLALFLDDLQWLDSATLDLLQELLTGPSVQHLMLIGAYRDNEVNSDHPLIRKLEAIRKAGAVVHGIMLEPLACDDLGALVGDALHYEPERVSALAHLIHDRTGGNPFFANQLIYSLAEEGMLSFDCSNGRWTWDLNRIRARGYADNVVDLMVGKLNRLPVETQQALQLLACIGTSARFELLEFTSMQLNGELHDRLLEAIRAGLISRSEHSYMFLHDRVQEAAYSMIPEESRSDAHLRIGRLLVERTPLEKREEAIFEIVNQLNRGATLITTRDEREQLAEFNLVAGKRATASIAYAVAQVYITAGRALLPEGCWEYCHALTFSLEFHLAECEFLLGALESAENRLAVLSSHGLPLHEFAAVTCLRQSLYTTLDKSDRAVDVCLDYLRQIGIQWSPHPTDEEVREEYEGIWRKLGGRPVEELVDLPLMSDPECRATIDVLSAVLMAALFTDENLLCLAVSRMANLSLEHGNSDGSCQAYMWVGSLIAGPRFGDYKAAFRFGQLGCDLVEQRGLKRFQAATYMNFGNIVLPWTRHIRAGRDPLRRAFDAANQSGDLNFAASCCSQLNTNLLAAGDPLEEVQDEAERGLAFARKTRFGLVVDAMAGQLGLIRTLRGLTPTFGSFEDEGFDESRFESHLANNPALALAEDRYWIRKLQARFFAGSYPSAIVAAANAERLLWTSRTVFERAEYHFYAALARAAVCNAVSAEAKVQHLAALAVDCRLLQKWAENCPENFAHRAALVAAECARLEGRELDAEQLYEQAIRSAQANGFVNNEALANELAARFYAARGFEEIAHRYLGNARRNYLLWGADGKVRQLDQLYPQLRQALSALDSTGTIVTPVEHLDLATVLRVSQAISSEIVQEKLLEILMRMAIEQSGAECGILVLSRWRELRIAAQGMTCAVGIVVQLHDEAMTAAILPETIIQHVVNSKEIVILNDAAAGNPFSADSYFQQRSARSVLCIPMLNQGNLIGVLYMENNLTSHAFAPARISVLKLLASQAAIALENARLYREVTEREKQQTAASEMLRIIASSPIESVLNAVVENAARLSDANNAEIFRLEDNLLRLVASYGEVPVVIHSYQSIPVNRDTVTGRAVCHRQTIHVRDLAAEEADYPVGSSNAKREGHHTTLATPLLRGGIPIGIVVVRRREIRPFSVEQIALIETFADQAVIAIENARLFEVERQGKLALEKTNHDLAEREAKIRRLVDSNIVGIFLWDLEGRFLEANDEFLRMVGYDREDLLAGSIRWTDLTPPDWRDKSNAMMEQQKSSGRFEPFENEYSRKDGSRVPVLIGGATFEPGGNEGVAFVVDLTARKRAEDDLRESEFKLREIIETMPSMLWSTDPDGEPNRINQRVLQYSGLLLEDFKRLGWKEFLHPEDFSETARAFYHAVQTGEPYEAVHRLRRADGQYRWHHARGEPLRNREGQIIQWYGLSVDIDERMKAEEALRRNESYLAEAQLKLAHANRVAAMGQLTASIAHEVNQPIGSARNNARAALNFLDRRPPDLGEVREALGCVVADADRAGGIVDRIRDQFRKVARRSDPVDLNRAIEEVIGLTQTMLTENGVSVQTRLVSGMAPVYGDRVQLQQVILNLILNAVEAMSSVDADKRELLISAVQSEATGTLVAVRDSGPGIDPQHLEVVFDAFYSTKSGMGMGLSICRSIIAAHGGRLWAATATEFGGAVFQFTLPSEDAKQQSPERSRPGGP